MRASGILFGPGGRGRNAEVHATNYILLTVNIISPHAPASAAKPKSGCPALQAQPSTPLPPPCLSPRRAARSSSARPYHQVYSREDCPGSPSRRLLGSLATEGCPQQQDSLAIGVYHSAVDGTAAAADLDSCCTLKRSAASVTVLGARAD